MRALLRLALWGTIATVCLALAVAAASSSTGSQRLVAALQGGFSGTQLAAQVSPAQQQPSAQLAARAAEAESERRRLTETLRALSADRDRLLTRMSTLEHSLQDITGSIKRQAAMSPQAASTPATPAATSPASAAAPAPASPAEPPGLSQPPATTRVAARPRMPQETIEEPKPELGVDIGGAVNFEGLRALWKSVNGAHAGLFDDMHPVVVARENARTRGVELRLIAGPVADADAAAKICASLTAVRRFCHPAEFEGQKLSLVAPEHERRPVAAPKTAPATVARPAPKR